MAITLTLAILGYSQYMREFGNIWMESIFLGSNQCKYLYTPEIYPIFLTLGSGSSWRDFLTSQGSDRTYLFKLSPSSLESHPSFILHS